MESFRVPYRRPVPAPVVSGVVLIAAIAFMAYSTLTNDRGLILNGLIHFGPEGATAFLGLLTFALTFLLGLLIRVAWVSLTTTDPAVEITPTSVAAPPSSVSREILTIPFIDIRSLAMGAYRGRRFLEIEHREGKLRIREQFLPQGDKFDRVPESIHRGISRQAFKAGRWSGTEIA